MTSKVTDIRYIGYGVPDLQIERTFYKDIWGLTEVAENEGMVYFSAEGSDHHHVVRLRQSDEKRTDVISMAANSKLDVDNLFDTVNKAGAKIIFEPKSLQGPAGGYGFRFFSPDGLSFEISSDLTQGSSREVKPWEAIPIRVSHVVMHSPDHKAAVDFFVNVLGFQVTDWLGDFMCFLRCNEWHHRIAFLPGPPCLDHVAYDVPSIDDLMKGIGRMKENGIDICWGPGRHTAGNNTFSYFQTPAGFVVEYTSGIETIDEDNWDVTIYEPSKEIMDQWGSGYGGPHTMPKSEPDGGLFKPVEM